MAREARTRVVAAVAIAAALVWCAEFVAGRTERDRHLQLTCSDTRCRATAGGPPLELDVPPDPHALRIGLYTYHPHEFDAPQVFRHLVATLAPDLGAPVEVDLADGTRWSGDAGWLLAPGGGLTHRGALGTRSVAVIEAVRGRDLTVDLDVRNPIDAGLLFRATDAENGWLFVVRRRYNDMFFVRLTGGRPGPILALAPLAPLRVEREALRLGGLVAEIVLQALGFVLALRVAARIWPLRTIGARRPRRRGAPAYAIAMLFAFGVAIPAAIALGGLGAVPHIADETAYLFQARVFASGAAWAPVPMLPEFFQHEHIVMDGGRWYGKYPPLFPALLALGVASGVGWLVNPLLAGLCGVAIFGLGRELAGWRWGIAAWLLALASPFFAILGATLMSHTTAALFVTLFAWMLVRALRRGRVLPAVAAGASLGCVMLTRPYTALLVGLTGAAWAAAALGGPQRRRVLTRGSLVVLAALPFLAAALAWSAWMSGGTVLELHAAYDPSDSLGFGPDKGAGWLKTWGTWGHTPAKALRSVWFHLDHTSHYLLGWPGRLSLGLLLAPFVLGGLPRAARLLGGVGLALVGGHAAYWATQHIGYGSRYWFDAVPGLLVLAAMGLKKISTLEGGRLSRAPALACAALVLWSLLFYLPERLRELPRYGGVSAELARLVSRRPLHEAIVFVETEGLTYNDGFHLNDPFLRGDTLFVRDLGSRNAQLLALHPGRTAYRWAAGVLTPTGDAALAAAVPHP
jgi:hypothetical protein